MIKKLLFLLVLAIDQITSQNLLSLSQIASTKQKRDSIYFDIRISNVESDKVLFELVDDNKTTLNYFIEYSLVSHDPHLGDIDLKSTLNLQTNSLTLIEKELEIEKTRPVDPDKIQKNGEYYNENDILTRKAKRYEDVHFFYINDLEPNRVYTIHFKIKCLRAHLSLSLLENQTINSEESFKEISLDFRTLLDESMLTVSCSANSSCYVENSNCTQCKPNCYQISKSPIVCTPCPCDDLKSSGECSIVQESINFMPEKIKCNKCKSPYTGAFCDECESLDYYKNGQNECLKCECNNNAYLDSFDVKNERKCNSSGFCLNCLFNTSGKHCDECLPGYHGNALHRTCRLSQTAKLVDLNEKLNDKYTYKSLVLFTLYIFIVLFMILFIYMVIRAKCSSDSSVKSEGNILVNFIDYLNESTRIGRVRFVAYINSLCPVTFHKMRSGNITSSNSNGIYNRACSGLNDDDRLNLAEYQVFDDSLLVNEDSFAYRPSDDIESGGNTNPYKNLTIKS